MFSLEESRRFGPYHQVLTLKQGGKPPKTALPCLHRLGREGEAAPMSCGAWQMQTRLVLQLVDGIFQPVTYFEHFEYELQRLQKKSSDLVPV